MGAQRPPDPLVPLHSCAPPPLYPISPAFPLSVFICLQSFYLVLFGFIWFYLFALFFIFTAILFSRHPNLEIFCIVISFRSLLFSLFLFSSTRNLGEHLKELSKVVLRRTFEGIGCSVKFRGVPWKARYYW